MTAEQRFFPIWKMCLCAAVVLSLMGCAAKHGDKVVNSPDVQAVETTSSVGAASVADSDSAFEDYDDEESEAIADPLEGWNRFWFGFNAVKIGGQKLYELARKGKEIERKPRSITIHELELLEGEGTEFTLRIRCSKGTYVRTLCHDLGRALGCGGCMSALRRTRAGSFALSQAVTMQQVLEFAAEHDPQQLLMPVDAVFSAHPPLIVTMGQAAKLKNGAQVKDWQFNFGTYRVYAEDGEFLLLGRVENGVLTTIKSFFEVNTLAT